MTLSLAIEAFFLGVALSMDALTVSLAIGAAESKKLTIKKILLAAGLFGIFQAVMPLTGWFGGSLCGDVVRSCGKIVASILLCGLGVKMLFDKEDDSKHGTGFKELLILAFATSIDALLVGVGYACLGRTGIGYDVSIIGCTTFCISLGGCYAGKLFGDLFGSKCSILGGIVLIALAVKILIFG